MCEKISQNKLLSLDSNNRIQAHKHIYYCCRLAVDIAGENGVIISTLRSARNVRYFYSA